MVLPIVIGLYLVPAAIVAVKEKDRKLPNGQPLPMKSHVARALAWPIFLIGFSK